MIRDSNFATISETRYKPFGQPRYVNGVSPTQRGFTGQVDEPDLGITFFQSRWYDPIFLITLCWRCFRWLHNLRSGFLQLA